jgi:glycosyltransferase involved in cell wall biosynthesis
MKIAVNTRLLRKDRMTGIELFTFETFSRIAANHPEHTFYYLFDRPYDLKFITSQNIVPVVLPFRSHYRALLLRFWFEFVLPRALKKMKPDILIAPDSMMSLSTKVPTYLVVHDIGFEHYPHHLPKAISRYLRKQTRRYVHAAERIGTVSAFSKSDIITHYEISPEKIDVVYNGANVNYAPLSETEKLKVRSLYCGGKPYFLFVGTIHPRKNLANQLRAFSLFRNSSSDIYRFLVVGDHWIWDDDLKDAYETLTCKDDVVFIGRLQAEELGRVVSAAEALMYASLFEGFGIPILEGFYAETPVITSNVSSMPEVAANAALCVDPSNPGAIAEAMLRIANEQGLAEKLIYAGKRRRDEFSWDRTADLLWQSVEKMLGQLQ